MGIDLVPERPSRIADLGARGAEAPDPDVAEGELHHRLVATSTALADDVTTRIAVRRIVRWRRMADGTIPELHENFAVGWFTGPDGAEPSQEMAVAIRSADESNGALVVAERGRLRVVAEGVPNVPLFVALGVRTRDVCVFVAAPEKVASIPAYPALRPVAILDLDDVTRRFFLVEQSVLGVIGFSVDFSRVLHAGGRQRRRCSRGSGLRTRPTPSSAAASSPASNRHALRGGTWTTPTGGLAAAPKDWCRRGSRPVRVSRRAHPRVSSARVAGDANAAVHWRRLDDANELRCEVRNGAWRLVHRESGEDRELASGSGEAVGVLEIVDGEDGRTVRVVVDGVSTPVATSGRSLPPGTGIGVRALGVGPTGLVDLEAHPVHLQAPAPAGLPVPAGVAADDPSSIWTSRTIRRATSRPCRAPTGHWRRDVGAGTFRVEPERGVVVDATATRPCPGRTIFTVPWPDPSVADLETTIVPPPRSVEATAMSRAGLVFWDDARNHLIVSLWLNDRPSALRRWIRLVVHRPRRPRRRLRRSVDERRPANRARRTGSAPRLVRRRPVPRVARRRARAVAVDLRRLPPSRTLRDHPGRPGRELGMGTDTGSAFRRLVGRGVLTMAIERRVRRG